VARFLIRGTFLTVPVLVDLSFDILPPLVGPKLIVLFDLLLLLSHMFSL